MIATVPELLARAAKEHGDRAWLTVLGQPDGPLAATWSFAAWERATARAAQVWRSLGVGPGDRAVIALPNRVEFLLAWHGLDRLGALMVPLNLHFRSREARHVLDHSGARIVLTTREHAEEVISPVRGELRELETVLDVEAFAERVAASGPLDDVAELIADDPAAVLYTSGTTGAPKGCLTSHAHFTHNGKLLADCLRMGPESTKLVMLPLFHMNAENSTMATLASGARMVLRDGFSASSFWSDVHAHDVTHTHYLGSVLPILDARGDAHESPNPLEVMWGAGCSGDALVRLEQRWGVKIIEVFGMTETGMDLCNPYDERRPGSCGVAVPDKEVRLTGEDGNEVPPGAVGEIRIRRAPGMTMGYLHDQDATARLYVDGWLCTGDLARRDEDGFHYFVDRAKDVIRRSGENISSAEIESALREHPDVVDVACVPLPDPLRDEEVRAIVVLRPGVTAGDLPPSKLAAFCADRIATYKVPRFIEYRGDLPRTPTGKIQKRPLREDVSSAVMYDADAGWAPRPATEAAL